MEFFRFLVKDHLHQWSKNKELWCMLEVKPNGTRDADKNGMERENERTGTVKKGKVRDVRL